MLKGKLLPSLAHRLVAISAVVVAPGLWFAGAALAPSATPPADGLSTVVKPPEPPSTNPEVGTRDAEEETNPLLDPRATQVRADLLAVPLTEAEKRSMAAELDRLQTRHATELVSVISTASREAPSPIPPSFLLSIAFAETRGRVLAVSPAGAVGLAQATPAAYLLEGFEGPLYITNQYLIGTRAFIMKKPLGDAVGIAGKVIEGEVTRSEALELLARAKELRRVGIDELEALEPHAPEVFMQRVNAADEYNEETLAVLESLLASGASNARLEGFRDRVRKEYRALLRVQQVNWKRYGESLERERDRVLASHFGDKPASVLLHRPYEAGEVLGEKLDGRFSPIRMAEFLSAHALTKRQQAIDLGVPDDEVEAWTAALYNGGLVNVTRMRAGLMSSIRETENYMAKVPQMRQQLDGVTSLAAP